VTGSQYSRSAPLVRLEGALDVQGRRFIATGARPPHPLLAAAQQARAEPQGQTFTDQLRRLDWRMGKLCPLPAGVPRGPPSRRAVAFPTSCAGKTGGAARGCYWSMG
jgi:hypothetical protein